MQGRREKTAVVLQPGYLPWLGFFDQLRRSDVFVYYDDVQYDKHGWRNRNRLKSPDGRPQWISVPVRSHGLGKPKILDAHIDNEFHWQRKHLGAVRQCYAKAPFFDRYWPELEELLSRRWELIVDLDMAAASMLAEWLGLRDKQILRSSELGVVGERSERLLAICRRLEATTYLSGNAAQSYLDVELFRSNGVEVVWQDFSHPMYPQIHGPFVGYLSALDLVMNCGERSADFLAQGKGKRP